jgi:hypothetical protein
MQCGRPCGGSGGRRCPRPERVDELEHVVGELAGTVGSGQPLDQLQSAVAVQGRIIDEGPPEELAARRGAQRLEQAYAEAMRP